MNILLLSDDMLIGGVTRHISDIGNALQQNGHMVIVAATDGPARIKLNPRIRFVALRLKNNESFKNIYSGFIPAYFTIKKIIEDVNIDIIHSHKRYSHALGKILSKRFKIPHITSYQNLFTDKKSVSFFGDKTICCSDAIKDSLIRDYNRSKSEVVTLYYGINPFREESIEEKKNIRKN